VGERLKINLAKRKVVAGSKVAFKLVSRLKEAHRPPTGF
jgi:hypothetical protein